MRVHPPGPFPRRNRPPQEEWSTSAWTPRPHRPSPVLRGAPCRHGRPSKAGRRWGRQSVYLQPGEVAAIADAMRQAAQGQEGHPRQGLLLATTGAFEALVDGGVVAGPALGFVPWWAARRHIRPGRCSRNDAPSRRPRRRRIGDPISNSYHVSPFHPSSSRHREPLRS